MNRANFIRTLLLGGIVVPTATKTILTGGWFEKGLPPGDAWLNVELQGVWDEASRPLDDPYLIIEETGRPHRFITLRDLEHGPVRVHRGSRVVYVRGFYDNSGASSPTLSIG